MEENWYKVSRDGGKLVSIIKRWRVELSLTSLTLQHYCACLKQGSRFPLLGLSILVEWLTMLTLRKV